MKTSSAKAKGRRAAKEVREVILDYFPELHADDVGVASSGVTGEDVTLSKKARDVLPVSIECKNVEALNVWKALEQAESNAGDHAPVLCFRRNRSKLYAAVDASWFFSVMRRLHAAETALEDCLESSRKEKSAR